MSYIKLDRTKINYSGPKVNRGGIILSQVLDSGFGPPSPVLLSTTTELDIYFGRSFKEREYFEELLHTKGIDLLLTTPMTPTEIPSIDISGYKEVREREVSPGVSFPIEDHSQLPKVGEEGVKYYVSSEGKYYIYTLGDWLSEDNIPLTKNPMTNRDTLRLVGSEWGEEHHLTWCWPKYSSREWTPVYTEKPDPESLLGSLRDGGQGDKSIGFLLDFSRIDTKIQETPGSQWTYIVFPIPGGGKIQFYLGNPLNPDILRSTENIQIPDTTLEDQIEVIIEGLRKYEWTCDTQDGKVWKIYTKDLISDLEFYNVDGLTLKGDIETTHNVLSVLSEDHKRMEFFSRTIGEGDSKISVSVSKIPNREEWYRVEISRYSYQEVFEGPLNLEYLEDQEAYVSLEGLINRESALVSAKVYPGEEGLPEGEFVMSRATKMPDWTPEDYQRGLEVLSEFGVSEDFLMIPRMEDYLSTGVKVGESWYTEYKDILEYTITKNCQALISNHPYHFRCTTWDDLEEPREEEPGNPEVGHMYFVRTGGIIEAKSLDSSGRWKTWGKSDGEGRWVEILETFNQGYTGNQIFNYINDPDNRLIYFFQDMTYRGWYRPAWYIFLMGLQSGEYQIETDQIIYPSPAEYYTEDKENLLEKVKSNYMSDNGHIFYYRKFFSHPGNWKYVTTILSRFCLDKVSNTVTRDFPKYLARETTGEIIEGLQNILAGLRSKYPIIHSLWIDRIEEDPYNQTLSVYLNLGIRETLDKDVKLSVTLNFNFT